MYMKQKYVVIDDVIILFSELLNHSQFKSFNPTSAGFVSIGVDDTGNPYGKCYGRSVSLGIDSNPETDTYLLNRQIFNNF